MTQKTVEPLLQYLKGGMRVSSTSVRFVQAAVLRAVSGCGFGRIVFRGAIVGSVQGCPTLSPSATLVSSLRSRGKPLAAVPSAANRLVDHDTKLQEPKAKVLSLAKEAKEAEESQSLLLLIGGHLRRTSRAGNEPRALNQGL
jgi:hypothetical protein